MIDPFGRRITYLRISVTDRCDLRCVYCMAENMTFLPKADLLSLDEIDRLAAAFVRLGVRKLRITGGEPLVRRNILWLFERLGRHRTTGALDELTITTNGSLLEKYSADLVRCGVQRVNVSLDTLDPQAYSQITRWGRLETVLQGLKAAKSAGLAVKINAVALRNIDEQAQQLISWCGEQGFDLTFIEVMPMGDIGQNLRADQYLPLSEARRKIEESWTLTPSSHQTGGPARYYTIAETGRRLGFITPLTHNFCESCNRVRLTCTGKLYLCLGQENNADLRSVLRQNESDGPLEKAIHEAIARKPKGHDFFISRQNHNVASPRYMNTTGG